MSSTTALLPAPLPTTVTRRSSDTPSLHQVTSTHPTTPLSTSFPARRQHTPRPNQADMQIINAALPRTGTMSLCKALEILGFPTHHMMKVLSDKEGQVHRWNEAAERGYSPEQWDDFLRPYKACVDVPSCSFIKELADVYPDAKVLITTRDADAWVKSLNKTMFRYQPHHLGWWLLKIFHPEHRAFLRLRENYAYAPHGFLKGQRLSAAALPAYVQDTIAFFEARGERERVLLYDLDKHQGWDALCPFLGVAVPDNTPWPSENASKGSGMEGKTNKTWDQNVAERGHDLNGDADRLVAKARQVGIALAMLLAFFLLASLQAHFL